MSTSDKARVEGARCPGAGDWLSATPSSCLGLKLSNEQLRIATSLRLGAPISLPHQCRCSADVSELATHHLSCRFSAGRHSRHASLNQIVKQALSTVNIPSTLEPTGLSRDDGKRPDGMTLTPFHQGNYLVWDVTCVDRLASSYRPMSTTEGPTIAKQAEIRKSLKYSGVIDSRNSVVFIPLAIETLGGLGSETLDFIRILSMFLPADDRLRFTTHLRQRLGIAVQIGNAASIQAAIKPDPEILDF